MTSGAMCVSPLAFVQPIDWFTLVHTPSASWLKTKFTASRAALAATLLLATTAHSTNLTLQVSDADGTPAIDAVVYAEAAGGQSLPKLRRPAQIEQKARQFAPRVTVVQTGSAISFPNHDTVRHQVYSFSPAKVFELKIYAGAGGEPVVFDQAGTVIVGCNIHDRMAAFIEIVDTPYFGKSDASGKATLENIAPGKYHLKVWHPSLPTTSQPAAQTVTIGAVDMSLPLALSIKLPKKPD